MLNKIKMKLPKAKKINTEKYSVGLNLYKNKIAKIKLSANESALGPSPKATKEYIKISKKFKEYPDTDGISLRNAIAKKFNLDVKRIILGSGSDQVLELICKAFLGPKDQVVVSRYGFIVYRMYSKIYEAKIVFAKEENYTTSVKNILSCITNKTKIVFLANPNNPTSTYINKQDIIKLRKKLRSNILLVIDDAYFEYVKNKDYESGLKLFSRSNNVIVTRTFSKIYGLAGLRIGWGYSSRSIIESLYKIKPPFNINKPALAAAKAAVNDSIWLKKEIKHIDKWRKIMFNKFKEIKIETNEGNTNFLLINFNRVKISSMNVFKKLAQSGILVRKMDNYSIKNSLRVTIGKASENKKFITKIEKIINV